jgi:hypothetical protein
MSWPSAASDSPGRPVIHRPRKRVRRKPPVKAMSPVHFSRPCVGADSPEICSEQSCQPDLLCLSVVHFLDWWSTKPFVPRKQAAFVGLPRIGASQLTQFAASIECRLGYRTPLKAVCA